jgi:hypothetical protein
LSPDNVTRFPAGIVSAISIAASRSALPLASVRKVLHHLFQGDQPFLAKRRQHLREQFIEFLLLFHTVIRQRVVVHFR